MECKLAYATSRIMPRGFRLPNIYRPSSVITGGVIRGRPERLPPIVTPARRKAHRWPAPLTSPPWIIFTLPIDSTVYESGLVIIRQKENFSEFDP